MLTALSFLCKVHSLIHPDGRMEEMEILNVKNQRDVVPRSPRILENKYCSKKSNLFNVQSEFCVRLTNPAAAAAAAAKSLQSCPTLCDPIDSSPPGSAIPGILQARTLEWVAISFSNAWTWKVKVKSLSHVQLLATPWTAAYQAPPSMGFSCKSTGVGCHCFLWLPILAYLKWFQRGKEWVMTYESTYKINEFQVSGIFKVLVHNNFNCPGLLPLHDRQKELQHQSDFH